MSNVTLPWPHMVKPNSASLLKKRRVDSNLNKNFWWTKDYNGHVGLRIEFAEKINDANNFNQFSHVNAFFDEASNSFSIVHVADGSKTVEVFFSLCLDVIDFTENFCGDISVRLLPKIFSRLAHWKSLFEEPTNSFPENQQIGLIGELSFINDTLIKKFNYKKVLNIWRGPIPEPQDFVSDKWAIEVKAQRATSAPLISISSLDQLDTCNGPVFINHRKFSDAISPSHSNLTLSNQIESILKEIGRDNFYREYFLGLLKNLGYEHDAAYSQKQYVLKVSDYYSVNKDFPRLMSSSLPNSIVKGSYTIDLQGLKDFNICSEELLGGLD